MSSYELDPFAVDVADKIALLADWSRQLLAADGVDHVDASLYAVKERKFYTDSGPRRRAAASPAASVGDRSLGRCRRPVRDDADGGAARRAGDMST